MGRNTVNKQTNVYVRWGFEDNILVDTQFMVIKITYQLDILDQLSMIEKTKHIHLF